MATLDHPPAPTESLDEFLRRMEPRLKRVLGTYRVHPDDAEDLLQDTLTALIYRWDRVRDPESWLIGALRRHCLMYWRKNRRQLYSAVDTVILEWLSEPVAPSQERTDMICDLENLLNRLPSRCRSVLKLRFRWGFEPTEIARRMGYQVSSIGKITHRCLAALSRELFAAGMTANEPEDALRAAERG